MFYIIYKVTNQINGKFYVGTHKTNDLNDMYMGSGKYLKRAQEKYGLDNFTKEILFVYDNPKEMYAKEADIVNADFLAEENTYNLKIGGYGGWDYINNNEELRIEKNRKAQKITSAILLEKYGVTSYAQMPHMREKARKRMNELHLSGKMPKPPRFDGKTHSDEAKKKIGESNSKHQSGEGNSQYGTRWIHSMELKVSKKIKKEVPLPEGWTEGRRMKF